MLTKLNKALILIATLSLCFAGYMFFKDYFTAVRWQQEAITNYQQMKSDWDSWKSPVPPPKKEKWWHENPIFVAAKAWAELGGNTLAVLVCMSSMLGRLWIRIKRRKNPVPT
jgi:hypothetical protein